MLKFRFCTISDSSVKVTIVRSARAQVRFVSCVSTSDASRTSLIDQAFLTCGVEKI